MSENVVLKKKDFVSDQEIRWCPGCGDYAILNAVQKTFPDIGVAKEDFLVVSGIGCSSRFPYYMNTFGFHSIHGRAPAIASGAKLSNPSLSVWLITGDGDAMSIGGNHFIHLLRRNIDINVLMFNNRIYGLTKGQYSPTSEIGKVTKSTPNGSLDFPFNPVLLAMGSGGTFIARTIDKDLKHQGGIYKEANDHKGTSFIEIYQNCNIFNDGAFSILTDRETKLDSTIRLVQDQPMVFGANLDKGIILDGFNLKVVNIGEKYSISDLLVHNKKDKNLAMLVCEMTYNDLLPTPFGVIYAEEKRTYDDMLIEQMEQQIKAKGPGNLKDLIYTKNTWTVS
jgi:2-oxoglutarate ferredoxin oxidoreductase subunit beta|tara:strand:- start:2476 stop:3486 length:1011 start_codon:yes stop_codon:yes gene_type:complete